MELGKIGESNNRGSLQYLFNDAISRVTENIEDPRTSYQDKRKIKIEFTITSDDERKIACLDYNVNFQLAPLMGGRVKMDIQEERIIHHPDYMPGQVNMDITREGWPVNEDGEILEDGEGGDDAKA